MEKPNYENLRNLLRRVWVFTYGHGLNFEAAMAHMGYVRMAETMATDLWVKGIGANSSKDTDTLRYQLEQVHREGQWDFRALEK
jgi:hypothetical protein